MVGGVVGGVLGVEMIPREYLESLEDVAGIVDLAHDLVSKLDVK
jgi:hypothetical protein